MSHDDSDKDKKNPSYSNGIVCLFKEGGPNNYQLNYLSLLA